MFLSHCKIFDYTLINIINNIPIINWLHNNLSLFMDWAMFSVSPSSIIKIKIIVETRDNLIDIFYINDKFIKDNIKELDLKASSLSGLINNYTSYDFLNDFLTKKFNLIYNKNLKYISIYKIIIDYNNHQAKETIKNSYTNLIYQHTYEA
jgi:hypothetical protein